jgi:hypothetical protein
MSKTGKKLLAAVNELVTAVKCDHQWEPASRPLGEGWTSLHCSLCGLTKHTPKEDR